jgi:glycosyltransferase involved in cell wall biosynthesis
MAMTRPVIGTSIAGVPELILPGVNGWLAPAGNVEELAGAMREALNTPAEALNRMGVAARERVRERHFTPTEVDKLERVFQEFIPAMDHGRAAAPALELDSRVSIMQERS